MNTLRVFEGAVAVCDLNIKLSHMCQWERMSAFTIKAIFDSALQGLSFELWTLSSFPFCMPLSMACSFVSSFPSILNYLLGIACNAMQREKGSICF